MSELVNPDGTPWEPEFHSQRPPFQPGNDLAVTHGAYSATRTDPIARRYIEEVTSTPATSYLAAPHFHAALWLWAVAAARVELIGAWIADMPDISTAADSKRGQTSPLELYRKWIATMTNLAKPLGLDPLSFAKLTKDVATTHQVDAATMLTRLRHEHEQSLHTDHDTQ